MYMLFWTGGFAAQRIKYTIYAYISIYLYSLPCNYALKYNVIQYEAKYWEALECDLIKLCKCHHETLLQEKCSIQLYIQLSLTIDL